MNNRSLADYFREDIGPERLTGYSIARKMYDYKKVKIKIVNRGLQPLPFYAQEGDSGMDLRSTDDIELQPKEKRLIPTGLYVAIPAGYEIQVRPRSGISWKTNLRVANSPGTIDSSYRGEIKVILENTSNSDMEIIKAGDRIAQIVLCEVPLIEWELVESLDETERGAGGFGSTGKQ